MGELLLVVLVLLLDESVLEEYIENATPVAIITNAAAASAHLLSNFLFSSLLLL